MSNQILIEDLKKCSVNGSIVALPKTPLANYPAVKKALHNAGGTYKKNTFVFTSNAQPFMDKLIGGDSVNIKKEYQSFFTPKELAQEVVSYINFFRGMKILEPSAGQGGLVDLIKDHLFKPEIDCIELMPENADILFEKGYNVQCDDFLNCKKTNYYDVVVANPPFTKNQDIDHIMKMYDVCKEGGQIISLSSLHWTFANDKKSKEFRAFIEEQGALWYEIKEGSFKESGTMVKSVLIVLDK